MNVLDSSTEADFLEPMCSRFLHRVLVENPDGVVVSSVEELVQGLRVAGVDLSVVDEVLAGVLGVVRSRVFGQPPHEPQHFAVHSQRLLHRLPSSPKSGRRAVAGACSLPLFNSTGCSGGWASKGPRSSQARPLTKNKEPTLVS